MITPELLSYMRGELKKGRTREEIRTDLIKGGGWKEEDLNDAFRIVIPMQGFFAPSFTPESTVQNTPNPLQSGSLSSPYKANFSKKWVAITVIFVLVASLVALSFFYRPQMSSLWGKVVGSMPEFSMPSFDFGKITGFFGGSEEGEDQQQVATEQSTTPKPVVLSTIDCGTSVAPDLKDTSTYQNSVLACVGNNALSCTPSRAILSDDLFPTVFQIARKNIGEETVCSFRLAYADDSVLVDVTGNKLAGQYITCPISAVKMIDESAKSFKAPNKDDPSMYAGQIYFYGTLGLFMEQNVDKSKILGLGCSGPYIDSVIASYKAEQGNN